MLQQGSIVWVIVDDTAGRNPKCRPAVVVTPTEEILPDQSIVLVAATGTFSKPHPENQVPLPWHRNKHPVTGLFKECVVVCEWLFEVEQDQIDSIGGVCPPNVLAKILEQIPDLSDE